MDRRIILMLLTFSLSVNNSKCYYAADEAFLLQTLRQNYSVDHRPLETTTVKTRLFLFALNKIDIGKETMSITAVLISTWYDPRLIWDPADHSDIQQIVIPTKYVWIPPLVVENAVNNVGVLGADGSPLRVFPSGIVQWTPPISTTTSCSVDITYYPFDRQTCDILLTGWSYTVDEVNLDVDQTQPVKTDGFDGNGEWDLLDHGYSLVNLTEEGSVYRKVKFSITFRRKWQFYGQNIIIPLILNSFLMAMVFIVPIESGEKMGYCLTVLLSYIVLLTLVSENLPSISSQTSVIQVYLTVVMCIGTGGTVFTIGVIRLYNKDERDPVPRWLQTVTQYILAPFTCYNCKGKRVVSPELNEKHIATKATAKYSFKEIAHMIDTACFRIFAILMLVMTVAFLVTLNSKY